MNQTYLKEHLNSLKSQNLYRQLREVSSPQGREIILNGQKVLNFCSNDYLGLANDPRILLAVKESIEMHGFGCGSSRLVCGNTSTNTLLESRLAYFKKTEAALIFSSGYMANCGIISTLIGRDDIVFSDRINHASIIDGIILSRAKLVRYPHVDLGALEIELKKASNTKRKLIITDSVFSMDGDKAPLLELAKLAHTYDAMLMVDEAHALGVLGKTGAGLVEELGLHDQIDIQMGTLSKAAGCFGAYVCGSKTLKEYLINHARSLIYSTGLPASTVAAGLCAINIIQNDKLRRDKLQANADYLRRQLQALGLNTLQSTTPIIPIIIGSAKEAVALSERLLAKNIFVQAIRPPTVPLNSARLRLTVTATHTQDDIDYLINNLKEAYA